MNGNKPSYCSRLLAVVAIALLGSSAVGQVPEDCADPLAGADQPLEAGLDCLSPHELPSAWGWGPPYYGSEQLYLRTEYVHWWLSGNSLPPLVTTSPAETTPALGMDQTRVLFGGNEVDRGSRGGFRGTLGVRLGHWFETDLKLETQLLFLEGARGDSGDFSAGSTGTPVLGRPFFNVQAGAADAFIVAEPNLAFWDPVTGMADPTLVLDAGLIQTAATSDLDGAGVLFRRPWIKGERHWVDLLAGYRYLRFAEALGIRQFQAFSDPGDPDRTGTIDVRDSFSTWSEFHGGELGIASYEQRGLLNLEVLGKVAIGNVHQILQVAGTSVVTRPGAPRVVRADSGILAAPSNVGRHTEDHVAIVPEIGVTLRRPLSRSSHAIVGYTLIIFPRVLRTGDQIDTSIDPSQTTARPRASLNDSTLWIQGLHVGLQW